MKKQLLTAGIVSVVGLAGVGGLATVSAATDDEANGRDGMISQLVERFNLDETEVSAFFDEQRESREAEREAKQAERLSAAVEEGELTQTQVDLITEKRAEIKAEREEAKDADLSDEERKANMEENRAELEAWAEENDIPMSFIGHGGKHGGPRH